MWPLMKIPQRAMQKYARNAENPERDQLKYLRRYCKHFLPILFPSHDVTKAAASSVLPFLLTCRTGVILHLPVSRMV